MSKQYPNRRSIRLKGYDYSQPGLYFITICSYNHTCIFGHIENHVMILNDNGIIVRDCWLATKHIRSNITLREFVVMPNHFHAIIQINHAPSPVGATGGSPELIIKSPTLITRSPETTHLYSSPNTATGPKPNSLGAIVAGYKSMATKRINHLRNIPGCSVWQRNYHERIIRNENAFHRALQYIINNPGRWQDDRFFRPLG